MRNVNRYFLALSFLLSVKSAHAVESSVQQSSDLPINAVWQRIGNFCGIGSWDPSIAKCELSENGKRRTMTLKMGGTVVEELVRWSDKIHSYSYRIASSPLPVSNYQSTLHVTSNGVAGSVISWTGVYKANGVSDAEAKKIVDGIYQAGVNALAGKAVSPTQ